MSSNKIVKSWKTFEQKYHTVARFLASFVVCSGVAVLQIVLMPVLEWMFGFTDTVNTNFQWPSAGTDLNGIPYYVFDYTAGAIASGGGGDLAYFLTVEITMAIVQVINFIAQRKVTFKAGGSVWKAAGWYVLACVVIIVGVAVLQGLYKAPIYGWLMGKLGEGTGATVADVITMLTNCAISFWVFFPLMKWIFKE